MFNDHHIIGISTQLFVTRMHSYQLNCHLPLEKTKNISRVSPVHEVTINFSHTRALTRYHLQSKWYSDQILNISYEQ